jgi:hypothetical protein
MKWFLNHWYGRLYLVVQVACLLVTIFLTARFTNQDSFDESYEISTIWRVDGSVSKETWEREKEGRIFLVNEAKERHSEAVKKAIVYCVLINLGIPAFWGICLFVAKGLPTRKS